MTVPQTRHLTALLGSLAASLLVVTLAAAPGSAAPGPALGTAPAPAAFMASDEAASTPELEQYLASLSPADRDEFVRTQLPAVQTLSASAPVRLSSGALAPAANAPDGSIVGSLAVSRLSALATGCWTQRWSGSAKAAAGNTLYTYYTTGGWCASGSTITSAWVADAGGETSTPGWRYDGVVATGSGIVSNQGRSYSQSTFVLSVGGFDVQSASPCVRVLGRTSGSSSAQYSCGLS
jgi:hypothetical protein